MQPPVNGEDVTARAGNEGGVPQEVVQRPCGICQSPGHQDADCPTVKLSELEQRMNERRASLRALRKDMSDDEGFEDIEVDEDGGFESEERGVELGNIATTREELSEFLHSGDNGNAVGEEEVTCGTSTWEKGVENQEAHFTFATEAERADFFGIVPNIVLKLPLYPIFLYPF